MKRRVIWLVMAVVLLAMTGCGGGDDDLPLFETTIESDEGADGYIFENSATGSRTVTLPGGGPFSVLLVGLDPLLLDEYQAFINFTRGAVPRDALIDSATLNVVIRGVDVVPIGAGVPILIELVSFPPPLLAEYFDVASLPALATARATISPARINDENGVDIPITALIARGQSLTGGSFQLRILHDFVSTPVGLIEIDESNAFAPQLNVVYF